MLTKVFVPLVLLLGSGVSAADESKPNLRGKDDSERELTSEVIVEPPMVEGEAAERGGYGGSGYGSPPKKTGYSDPYGGTSYGPPKKTGYSDPYGGTSYGPPKNTGYSDPSGYGKTSYGSGYGPEPSGYGKSTSGYKEPSGYGKTSYGSGYGPEPSGYGKSTSGYKDPSGYGKTSGYGEPKHPSKYGYSGVGPFPKSLSFYGYDKSPPFDPKKAAHGSSGYGSSSYGSSGYGKSSQGSSGYGKSSYGSSGFGKKIPNQHHTPFGFGFMGSGTPYLPKIIKKPKQNTKYEENTGDEEIIDVPVPAEIVSPVLVAPVEEMQDIPAPGWTDEAPAAKAAVGPVQGEGGGD